MTQWVTAKVNTDVLEKDKDYKVIRYVTDGWDGEYKIQLPDGDTVIVSDEFFYKDDIPTFCEEDEKGFDNLVYIIPFKDAYLVPETLSEDQKIFLNQSLGWFDSDRFIEGGHVAFEDGKWCGYESSAESWGLPSSDQIFFNDIFKER